MPTELEWWPEADGTILWRKSGRGGVAESLAALPLPPHLVADLGVWVGRFTEDALPSEGSGDPQWPSEGAALLVRVRGALGDEYVVVTTEPWWGDEPIDA